MFAQGLGDYLYTTAENAEIYEKLRANAKEAGWSDNQINDRIVWRGYSDIEFDYMQDHKVFSGDDADF